MCRLISKLNTLYDAESPKRKTYIGFGLLLIGLGLFKPIWLAFIAALVFGARWLHVDDMWQEWGYAEEGNRSMWYSGWDAEADVKHEGSCCDDGCQVQTEEAAE